MPGFRDRFSRTDFFNIAYDDDLNVRFSQTIDKSTTAMWRTGEVLGPPQPPALILIGDTVPGDTSTTATLVVDAPHTIGTTETIGDQDFYKVTLVAGQDYEIGMYMKTGGPSGIGQVDSYIEVYDSAGNLLASGDGGANTLHNNANSGFDVLMTFTAETSGTYYINARAFDEDPTNGTTGDTVGDYEVFVQTASPFAYHPYYDADSPLYSIDWGTQVDGSSRNPDGDEGPRVTGNPETGYAYNPYGIEGKNVITYYFAKQGEVFIDEDPTTPGTTDTIVANGFADWEKAAYLQAMAAYSNVADIVYVEVPNRAQADFVFITYNGTPGPGVSLLGQMNPPDEENEGRSMFNAADERWTEEGLQPGGFSFVTLVHEMGHGHGLAHPHDNGGHSGIMHGVEPEGVAFDYTNGDFDLNQGIYTVMSYEDGWQKSPYGQAETTDGFGWQGSLMAFDVAAIQDKYGVNEDYHTGNDAYVIKDVNAPGTMYLCIWDAGGIDSITYSGAANANIDLRPATLKYEYGGGGWVSYAYGIYGGYTIANGVTIENATSGSGNDTLIGNDVANYLDGGAGADTLTGLGGNDTIIVDAADLVVEQVGGGFDNVAAKTSYILNAGAEVEVLSTTNHGGTAAINLNGNAFGQSLIGNAGNNYLDGGGGADVLIGLGGNDTIIVDADDLVVEQAGGGYDNVAAKTNYVLNAGAEVEVLSTTNHGGTAAINLTGNEFGQSLIGNAGANTLNGGAGADALQGLGGADTFAFTTALGGGNVDAIADFVSGTDKIALDDAVFTAVGGLGALNPNAFFAGAAAHDGDDRIIYNSATGQLFYDADGNGAGAAVLFATMQAGTVLAVSDFQVI
jgi:Ca2+-binding RTX toxin-like protein